MFEKQLTKFRDALQTKAQALAEETVPIRQKGNSIDQGEAVKLAQLTIRSLVLLDIAEIITRLL